MCMIITWRNLCEHCEAAAVDRKQKKVEYFACRRAEYLAGTKDARMAFRACGYVAEHRTRDYFGNIEAFQERKSTNPYRKCG